MTLYEKSLNSFLTNALNNFYTAAPAPILTIADVLPVSSAPVLSHVANKIVQDDHFHNIFYINADPTTTTLTHPTFPTAEKSHRIVPIRIDQQTTTSTAPHHAVAIPRTNYSIPYYTPTPPTTTTILQALIPAVRTTLSEAGVLTAEQQATTGGKQKPSIVIIDGVNDLLERQDYQQLSQFLHTILRIPTISGIVMVVHTDVLCGVAPTNVIHATNTNATLSAATTAASVLDHLTALSTTFLQILPPPGKPAPPPTALQSSSLQHKLKHHTTDSAQPSQTYNGQCILSARIAHSTSNGKMTAELVSLWTYHNTLSLRGSFYSDKQLQQAGDKRVGKDEGEDLLATLGDLPFKLTLTAQQQKARSNVELPYAHQGGQQQQQAQPQQPQQTKSTSVLGGGVLLNNHNISQSWSTAKFEDVVSDDEEDEEM